MMNKHLAGLYLIAILALVSSCKKNGKSSLQHDYVTGKWRKTRIAIDTNNNGRMDTIEFQAVTSYDSVHVLVFNNDGSGLITSLNVQTGTFSWALDSNNTVLKMQHAGATTAQHIDLLTKDAMRLTNTSGTLLGWDLFTKQ